MSDLHAAAVETGVAWCFENGWVTKDDRTEHQRYVREQVASLVAALANDPKVREAMECVAQNAALATTDQIPRLYLREVRRMVDAAADAILRALGGES